MTGTVDAYVDEPHDDDAPVVTAGPRRGSRAAQAVPLLLATTTMPPPPPALRVMHDEQSSTTSPYANSNVRYTIAYNLVDGACVSVWSAQLLPLLVARDGTAVTLGAVMMVCGVAQIAGAAAAARAARAWRREHLLRVAVVVGSVAVLCFLLAVQCSVRWVAVAQGLWGVYVGMASTVTEALFADSVVATQRAALYSVKWIVQTLCYEVGYAFALVMLCVYGNTWSDASIRAAMRAGLALQPIAFVLLWQLREAHALPAHTHDDTLGAAVVATTATATAAAVPPSSRSSISKDKDQNNGSVNEAAAVYATAERAPVTADAAAAHGDGDMSSSSSSGAMPCDTTAPLSSSLSPPRVDEVQDASSSLSWPLCAALHWLVSWSAVPYVVCLVDLLMAVGSGMSLPFFSPFFALTCGFTPVQMYVMYMVSTAVTALVAHGVRLVAERHTGRLPVVLVTRAVGITALLCLSLARNARDDEDENGSTHSCDSTSRQLADSDDRSRQLLSWGWLALLFVLRNSCMNAVLGLTRSVIMDAVRRENRAKWSAFESFSSFTWSGSAIIGGYIAEAHSYQYTFTITSFVHYAALAVLAPAIVGAHRVERELMRAKREKAAAAATASQTP